MTSGFEKPITIREAVNNIDKREYLLPALQRQFVWSSYQIEVLFDSIMREYPINSFMLWKVTEPSIKNNLKFYEFLKIYRQRYSDLNPEFQTKGYSDFYAVIDGQQRLTSIYLGLKGSYAYKEPRKWWKDDEECLPTRHLYLDLGREMPEDNEKKAKYDFQFLSVDDVQWYRDNEPVRLWYEVGQILTLQKRKDLDDFIDSATAIAQNAFAKETVRRLWYAVHEIPSVNYYLEHNQDLAIVLDIFIRTNSGGQPLSFSDLLMSVITANWQKLDARKEIPDVIGQVFAIRGREFQIDKDFVLKTCLVLLNVNIKFQVQNFDKTNIARFEEHWPGIKKSIIAGFELVADFGISNLTLKAKNAVIPIIYFIHEKNIASSINHPLKYVNDKLVIKKWLIISLLKGVFGGQSDAVLTKIRRVLHAEYSDHTVPINMYEEEMAKDGKSSFSESEIARLKKELDALPFPFQKIKGEFASDPAKNLSFEGAFVDDLLATEYESPNAYLILSLLYPHLDYFNQDIHKDHLHPANFFRNIEKNISMFPAEDVEFFKDTRNWNSILNLQMLNGSMNSSKNSSALEDWVMQHSVDLATQIIPTKVDLKITNFRQFIDERRKLLEGKIKGLL